MFSILSRLCIKNYEAYDDVTVRQQYGVLGSILGIILNCILFGFKYFAGVISGSVAIMADALNNLSDAGSSIITFVGFKITQRQPDDEHPFGHGRSEYISGFIVSIAIILMGVEVAKSSFEKILKPQSIDTSMVSIVIIIVSILVKIYMAFYNHNIGKKIHSTAMKATAIDSLSDVVATSVVLLSILVAKFKGINVDGYCGVLVALFILFAGYQAAKDTLTPLLGTKPNRELVEQIEQTVLAHRDILGLHDLIIHDYGPGRMIISLHAEVNGEGNIYTIHDMIDNIERELNEKFHCESVIHMDPIDIKNEKTAILHREIITLIASVDQRFTIHDFRMVKGDTHTNLIFDIVIPSDYHLSEKEIQQKVCNLINERYDNYNPIIKIDKPYV